MNINFEVIKNPAGLRWANQHFPPGTITGTWFDEKRRPYDFACVDFRIISMSKTGKPALQIYTYNGHIWLPTVKANTATELILELFYQNEELCEKAAGLFRYNPRSSEKTHLNCKINTRPGWSFYGINAPINSIYGQDERGIFVCEYFRDNYRFTKQGFPLMKIKRLYGAEFEASPLTNQLYEIIQQKNLSYDRNAEAEEIASKFTNKPEFGEVHYCTGFGGSYGRAPGKYDCEREIVIVIGNTPIDQRRIKPNRNK